MKTITYRVSVMIAVFALAAFTTAFADELVPIPITADEAFDAMAMQIDPAGSGAPVILIDVRDPDEIFFNGAAARVTKIHLGEKKGDVMPDDGKVRLLNEGKFIEYSEDGRYRRVQVAEVEGLETEAMAINIPFWLRTDGEWVNDLANTGEFYDEIAALEETYPPDTALILYCRTGGRSSRAGQLILNGRDEDDDEYDLDPLSFYNVYEIDDPSGTPNHGGFSGPEYASAFNGHAGFPGRLTEVQPVPSASWMDAGLPVKRAVLPMDE